MPPHYRARVGTVRPSHLMFTSGVGALVDLPNFSAIVCGLDEWDYRSVPDRNRIIEPRMLEVVRRYRGGRAVTELRAAPWLDLPDDVEDVAWRVGTPIKPFPNFLRCTVCNALEPIDGRGFRFDNDRARQPHEAKFVHVRSHTVGRPPLGVTARFALACTNGHLDDFPYVEFVHQGGPCPAVPNPSLQMDDRGGNLGANVEIRCKSCDERRNLRDAQGQAGARSLPACRGRHPHLGRFDSGCRAAVQLLVVGASNQWFPQNLSVLSVPQTGASALAAEVEKHWDVLASVVSPEFLNFLWLSKNPVIYAFEAWPDREEIWTAIETHRGKLAAVPVGGGTDYVDPKDAEWEVFTAAKPPEPNEDFTIRRDPAGVPKQLAGLFADVVQVERLREVRALVGFSRLDAPDADDPGLVAIAPLMRSELTWVPASEVRGEGLFVRVPEEVMAGWESRVSDAIAVQAHQHAYARFRQNRYSERIGGPFDPMKNWPGLRYYALHTLSHLLIRAIATECGYSSASLAERIYSSGGWSENEPTSPRAGILIYTAVPDAEGTLGGLVSLGEPAELTRITRLALRGALRCSSDPLCAERLPHDHEDFVHGAACHVCLFVSETTCERGNRFLDRRFVVPLRHDEGLALFPELP